ncbi:hypothetical protein [Dechloromonas denitrificans]|uniref:hypothetical protein n=1 Tax=Dechloromonas denitrificans TaxID=281362 RepID=UPI001CF97144|nr:hypothetical protein KI615_02795 [Dechloromonas denitrificans]
MATGTTLKSREQARRDLVRHGISVAAWARQHGVTSGQVRDVLRKDCPCNWGASHKIAVLLGIKDGVIDDC